MLAPVQVLLYYRSDADVAAWLAACNWKRGGKKTTSPDIFGILEVKNMWSGACWAIKNRPWLLPFMIFCCVIKGYM